MYTSNGKPSHMHQQFGNQARYTPAKFCYSQGPLPLNMKSCKGDWEKKTVEGIVEWSPSLYSLAIIGHMLEEEKTAVPFWIGLYPLR